MHCHPSARASASRKQKRRRQRDHLQGHEMAPDEDGRGVPRLLAVALGEQVV
jgi:hypothetical protein